ncbi:MAG: RagB/SusD family nutrient uptake outer membrane protein [Tannerellaceae bacterium]|jgi:hypothetical protein|nr:RagB/SusD family nutrient uptake outer membrane protein [Tannerellaceae bacterium]
MKKISIYTLIIVSILTSCDDDFMNEIPQTQITVPGYFNTVGDLETYCNRFYVMMPWGGIRDADSDNATGPGHSAATETWNIVYGLLAPDRGNPGGWGEWSDIRSANILLDNVERVTGVEADIKHWTGFARYIRALKYIALVQRYSDVPYIEHAISSADPDVYRASDPRTYVVDKIMEDLEYASANMKTDMGNRTRVHKYSALTLLSRFSLYEGTYRKYHAELNLQSTANRFLERAVTASEEIMNSGQFAIAGTSVDEPSKGIKGSPAYRAIFASIDLSSNKEVIQWVQFRPDVDQGYAANAINSYMFSLSRSLMESYLTTDGKPYSTVPGYATLPYFDGFVNRDPRLAENFAHPGSSTRAPSFVKYENDPIKGGYCQEKFEANQSDKYTWRYEGLPTYRYAEVLLNYAEAKAELGQFTAEAAEKSINLLRTRVGMPAFDASREVDQTLRNLYPNVNDATILAVRRERRVELACEGFRLLDIYRWAVGERFLDPEAQQGMYVPSYGTYDNSGDENPDYAIYAKESDIPTDWTDKNKYGISKWYHFNDDLPGETRGELVTSFDLSEGTKGYVTNRETTTRGFRSPRDYYRPINIQHIVLNPNIKQPPGW